MTPHTDTQDSPAGPQPLRLVSLIGTTLALSLGISMAVAAMVVVIGMWLGG